MDMYYPNVIIKYIGWAGIVFSCANIGACVWEIAFHFNITVTLIRLLFQLVMLHNCITFISSTIAIEKPSVSSLFLIFVSIPLIAVSVISTFIGSLEMIDYRSRSMDLLQRMFVYLIIQTGVRFALPLKSSL